MISDNDLRTGDASAVGPTAEVATDRPTTAPDRADESASARGKAKDLPAEDAAGSGSGASSGNSVSVLPPALVELADTRSARANRWSALEAITVRGFKAVDVATIPLDRVTILVGPNGCGKSSVLQAIHWAARAASYVRTRNTKEMISFERLDYLPPSEPLSTLHKAELKSDAGSTPVEVTFAHRAGAEEAVQVTIRIRAARNRGGITVYMDGGSAVTPYKQRYQFITTYTSPPKH